MKDLIKLAVTLSIIASVTMNLPKILYKVRVAQLKLIQESKASKWRESDDIT